MLAAVTFAQELSKKITDLLDLMTWNQEKIAEHQQCADEDLTATRNAQSILSKDGVATYDKACKALISDFNDCRRPGKIYPGTFGTNLHSELPKIALCA